MPNKGISEVASGGKVIPKCEIKVRKDNLLLAIDCTADLSSFADVT